MLKHILGRIILLYFRSLAILQLKKNPKSTIIGITGSSGKTSTKEAIVQILHTRGKVKTTQAANSESGIPLDILGLHPTNYSVLDWLRLIVLAPIRLLTFNEYFDYYVVEMGIDSPDSPKNMSYLLSIIKPNVGVVLNAGLTHTANFDYLVKDKNPLGRQAKLVRLVAKEKMKLAKGVSSHGVAIVNIDQKELQAELKDVTARRLTYGKSKRADLRIVDHTLSKDGFRLTLSYQGAVYHLLVKDILSDHYAYTFASAVATTASLGIPLSVSLKALSDYRSPSGRMRTFAGIKDSILLDSSYNANPDAVLESLKLLKKVGARQKKIAVLGDMNELGMSSKSAHKQLADQVIRYCDEAILYGPQVKDFTLPVLLAHKFPVHHFAEMPHLIAYLQSQLKKDTYVLFKGSQNGIFLERAVEAVLAKKADQRDLCRRGKYWDKLRSLVP